MARKQFLDWGFQEEATTLFGKQVHIIERCWQTSKSFSTEHIRLVIILFQGQDGHQCEFRFT